MSEQLKRVWPFLLVAVTCLLTGFGYGRFMQPDQKIVEDRSAEVVALQKKVDLLTKELTVLRSQKTKVTLTKFSPTTGKKTSQRTAESTDTEALTRSTVGITGTENMRSVTLAEHRLTLINDKPRWNISILGGVSIPNFTRPTEFDFVLGAHVQYRFAGPFAAGVWGMASRQSASAGISLGVQF